MAKHCEGRVVIITGAGGGLGKSHAKLLASEGAKVIVNDVNESAALKVVEQISSEGGKAIANTSDITSYGESFNVVEQALQAFGDLHCVVNNAGINRDRMFASMTEDDWDMIISVHLKGHFCISSHAVRYWRGKSKEGAEINARIINTSSGAGLQGSIGQSNYAAAKAGIAALTLNQAAELSRYGITANTIVPAARTGMTTAVAEMAERMKKPEDGSFDYWAPENVSPVVAYLASIESKHVTGKAFEIEGGRLSVCDGWRSTEPIDKGDRWDIDELAINIGELIDRSEPAQKVWGT